MNCLALKRGFTLVELLIGMTLAAFLITGITQLVLAAARGYQLQQNLSALQENARFAFSTMRQEIEAAGYHREPWISGPKIPALGELTADNLTNSSDRLSIQRWTDLNCYGNSNAQLDEQGAARFYLRQSSFVVSFSGNLAMTCRYGPAPGQLTTQVNNLGLVQNVEAFHARYAEDSDADGNADRWVAADQWDEESKVMAVQLALLLATPDSVKQTSTDVIQVLDVTVQPPGDGRLRRVFESSAAIKGRTG